MLNIKSLCVIALASSALLLAACGKKDAAQNVESQAASHANAASETVEQSAPAPEMSADQPAVESAPATEQSPAETEAINAIDKPS